MPRNGFFLKYLSIATGNFWIYCGQSLAGLCLFSEVRQRISKLSTVKTYWIFFSQWKGIGHMCEHENIVVYGKPFTAQKLKFSIKDFFSNCEQIRKFLQIWSHLLKKSLMENFIFCAVIYQNNCYFVIDSQKSRSDCYSDHKKK